MTAAAGRGPSVTPANDDLAGRLLVSSGGLGDWNWDQPFWPVYPGVGAGLGRLTGRHEPYWGTVARAMVAGLARARTPVDRLGAVSTRRPPATTSARSALRLAGLLLVLAGLFGMHGLASHGDAGMETIPQAVMAEMSTSPAAVDLAVMATVIGDHARPLVGHAQRAVESLGASRHGGMDMGMAAMCVAILAVALSALIRLLLGRGVGPVLWLQPRQSSAVVHPGRDPDPPSLIALSIQCC